MKIFFNKIIDILFLKGCLFAFFKWKIFSLSSFKVVNSAKLSGVNPQIVIDVGANIGQFSEACYQIFNKVRIIAIEPDFKTAKVLEENLINKNSKIINKAISSYTGKTKFNVNSDSQASSLLPLGIGRKKYFEKTNVIKKITVPVTTLDKIIDRKILKNILIKIDTQGSEFQVLKGAKNLLKKTKWVIIEVPLKQLYFGQKNFNELNKLMVKNKFTFKKVLNFHYESKNNEIIEMDLLYIRK